MNILLSFTGGLLIGSILMYFYIFKYLRQKLLKRSLLRELTRPNVYTHAQINDVIIKALKLPVMETYCKSSSLYKENKFIKYI